VRVALIIIWVIIIITIINRDKDHLETRTAAHSSLAKEDVNEFCPVEAQQQLCSCMGFVKFHQLLVFQDRQLDHVLIRSPADYTSGDHLRILVLASMTIRGSWSVAPEEDNSNCHGRRSGCSDIIN
jgi:hypothetical protein